jgi:multisubunit Na+/H+ antiporter MnhB subunit
MVGLLLAWLWITHRRVERNRMVALIYVVLGAGFLFYTIIASIFSFKSPYFAIYFYVAPNSLASFASSSMIVFGLQRLFFGQSAT